MAAKGGPRDIDPSKYKIRSRRNALLLPNPVIHLLKQVFGDISARFDDPI
jgi:hypothetical protein